MSERHECPACDFVGESGEMFRHLATTYGLHNYRSLPKILVEATGAGRYSGGFKDVAGKFEVAGLEVTILPSAEARRAASGLRATHGASAGHRAGLAKHESAHRVLVRCPDCKRQIPAGRAHQHAPVHGGRRHVCDVEGCGAAYGASHQLYTHKKRKHK